MTDKPIKIVNCFHILGTTVARTIQSQEYSWDVQVGHADNVLYGVRVFWVMYRMEFVKNDLQLQLHWYPDQKRNQDEAVQQLWNNVQKENAR